MSSDSAVFFALLLKEMQKHHIRNCSKQDGDEGLVLPFIGDEDDGRGEQFWDCGGDAAGGDVFHAVDDQYRHNRRRQCLAEALEGGGHFAAAGKCEKWKRAESERDQGGNGDGSQKI